MSRLSVRVLLLLICLAAIGGAAFHIWSSDRVMRAATETGRRFHLNARAAATAIADLRAAQQAYVATGQGEAFWFERVTAIRAGLDEQIADLKRSASTPEMAAALDDAAAALLDFSQMDQRARDYTRSHQLTLASDMVFADGIELTRRAADAIARAATAEQVGRDASTAAVQKTQAMALGGAAAITTLGLLLLVPARRTKDVPAVQKTPAPAPRRPGALLGDLDELRPTARPAAPAPATPAVPAPAVKAAAKPPSPAFNFGGVATLCNDLARVGDTRALPALLERTASLLDASGIILWIADPDGRELAPILVHGYPAHLATRLGTIARDAGNLTASAYRTALLQTVKGDTISSGAIAVPLVAPGGCVGVMAAEVKNGGEQRETLLAAATIVAAQLATLVGPPSARTKAEAAG